MIQTEKPPGTSRVEIIKESKMITAKLQGDIDHHNLIGIRSAIDCAMEAISPSITVLDFSGVSFMDSSGIGLILGRIRLAEKFGGKVVVTGPNNYVKKIIKLSGLSSVIAEYKEV